MTPYKYFFIRGLQRSFLWRRRITHQAI